MKDNSINKKESEMRKGKVWLVGAGPSDVGLFTLKGKAVLEGAETVVYDRLVGQGILSLIPSTAKLIAVGKESGNHPIPQHEINKILLEEALEGKKVVRLKGGDPFVFGRGGEELELLCQHQIPFEIVPGVTSAISVPAYNGIPVTHRDFCSSLHIITGHTKKSEEADIDYSSLIKLEGTLIFLMGLNSVGKICKGLIDAGMAPDMPAAILERGTTAHQRRVISTVAELPEETSKAQIQSPAIFVVGKVCTLAHEFHWAEDRPLGGLKIAITRPKDRSSYLAEKLMSLGAEVMQLTSIDTKIMVENEAFDEALQTIEKYQWICFTSPFAVKAFYDRMAQIKMDIRKLAGIKFAAIGSETKKAIESKGILVDLMPKVYSGEDLGRELAEVVKEEEALGKKSYILLPRSRMGTEQVITPFVNAGLAFDDIPIYDTLEMEKNGLVSYDDSVDYVAFTSASTVRGFVKMNPLVDYATVKAICIGQQTCQEALKHGMKCFLSKEATMDSMIDCLLEQQNH